MRNLIFAVALTLAAALGSTQVQAQSARGGPGGGRGRWGEFLGVGVDTRAVRSRVFS